MWITLLLGMQRLWVAEMVMHPSFSGTPWTGKDTEGSKKKFRNALETHYLKDRLISAGIGAMLNELSSTVVIECPQVEEFIRKWQLACQGNIAHVVVMPNITIDKLDDFMNELVQKRDAWFQDGKLQPPCIASDVGKENCLCALHKWNVWRIQNFATWNFSLL